MVDAPAAVALGGADPDLARFIAERLAAARAAPQSAEMRGRLAMTYDMNGFPEAAAATYGQAAALDSTVFEWPYFRALVLAKQGDTAAALETVEFALGIDPDYIPAWLWRGAWALDQGDLETAATSYRRAEALDAGSPAAAGLAQVALRREQPEAAAALLEPANAQLRHPHLYRMLGRAYRALGRSEDARIAFARGRLAEPLQWLDPRQAPKADYIAGFTGQRVHAQKLLRAGDAEGALKLLEPWREKHGDDEALLSSLGWGYMSTRQWERALEVLEHGLEVHPSNYYFHFNIARLHRDRGDADAAEKHLLQAIAVGPTQPAPQQELGMLRTRQGRHDEALEAFDAAIRHGAKHPEQILQTSGVVEAARGRWAEAIERFQRAVDLDPSFTMAYVHLARSLIEAERFDEAEEALAWAERLATHPREIAAARKVLAERRQAAPR